MNDKRFLPVMLMNDRLPIPVPAQELLAYRCNLTVVESIDTYF